MKQKYFAITIEGTRCVTELSDTVDILREELEGLAIGDSFTVEAMEMTQEEFNALREFAGW